MSRRRVLVAGGGGFIGGHLVGALLARGCQVRCVASDVLEPVNLGSSELTTIDGLVDVVEDIAGVRLERRYRLDAPKGVNGRNSDNGMILRELGWEPSIRLRDGMEQTYRWVHDEYVNKYG